MGLGDALTRVTEGEVEYQGKRATIKINHETCVGVGMCVVCCPVDIFESNSKAHLVKENLHKCPFACADAQIEKQCRLYRGYLLLVSMGLQKGAD